MCHTSPATKETFWVNCLASRIDSFIAQQGRIRIERMKNYKVKLLTGLIVTNAACWFASAGSSGGIPEPDLVMYGKVINTSSNANLRLGYGELNWSFQPIGGGTAITGSTILTNINNQFSYILHIPCETPVFGYSASTNTIQLTAAGITLNRAYVTWNGTNLLSLAQPALSNTTFYSTDRGRIEQVDLNVSSPLVFDPNNGLPIDWELTYFGRTGIDPNDDPDHDGMSNFAEYKAGTNPNDPLSGLRFTQILAVKGGVQLKWLSADFKSYALQRSLALSANFVDIMTGIAATAPTNSILDTTATGFGPYFYRLRLEDALSVNPVTPLLITSIRPDALGGIRIDWLSRSNSFYAIQRSPNLASGFIDLNTNIPATPPTNSFRDISATGFGPYFYRLRLGP